MLVKDQIYKSTGSDWYPIEILLGMQKSFIGWTVNDRLMVFNEKLVDHWLIDKYQLTHYSQPKPNTMEDQVLVEARQKLKIVRIAIVCHEANKAWCYCNGDHSQLPWADAQEWQRESAIKGVQFKLDNPDAGNDAQHNSWMKEKTDAGWVYGEVKDAEKKTHPCIVPYDQLPEVDKKKDAIFCAIVNALK